MSNELYAVSGLKLPAYRLKLTYTLSATHTAILRY
jgi:hypothetical protein